MPTQESVKAKKTKAARFEPLFAGYKPLPHAYDELFRDNLCPREDFGPVVKLIDSVGKTELNMRQRLASRALFAGGLADGSPFTDCTPTVLKSRHSVE